jgi:hypothetical protein
MIKQTIGENAGKIWTVLNDNREMNLKELKKATLLNEKDLHLALGWLSKENKVFFFERNNELNLCLIDE